MADGARLASSLDQDRVLEDSRMTDAPSWRRVKEIFQGALEREPEERAAFVVHKCDGNDALGKEVESLLASLDDAGSFVERPAIQDLPTWNSSNTGPIAASPEAALMPGDSLGPYRIVELVGAGGMGEVYRARDPKLNRDVALKILPDIAARPAGLDRLRREAQVLASLNHPNIGHIYGLEDGGVRQALVLELVDGLTLAEVIASGRRRTAFAIDFGEALGIALQIAQALEAAHNPSPRM
jgi:eukaryotic-like serine/threonine-protein kinase